MFLLLMFRRPDSILNPQFWAEDGFIFFKDQLQTGLGYSLFHQYMGYLHFVPRLVASFASWFPVQHAPLIYNSLTTALEATAFSLFALPAYRFLIKQDYLRIATCAVAAGVFLASEVLGTITNVQWHLAIGAVVILFYPVPESRANSLWFQLISGGMGIIVVCTSPQTLILLPIVLWKILPLDRIRSIGPLLVTAGMAVQTYLIATTLTPALPKVARSAVQLASVTLAAPIYRCLLADLAGDRAIGPIASRFATAMNVSAILAFLLWLLWLFWSYTGAIRWSVAVAAYALFASIAVAAARRPFAETFNLTTPWVEWDHQRYVLLGSVMIVYLAALTLQQLVGRFGAFVPTLCLVGLFAYGLNDHYAAPAFADLHWPDQAKRIESWVRATGDEAMPSGLALHLNPAPFRTLYLPARLRAASAQSPWEGCLLRGQGVFGQTRAVYWIEQGKAHPVTADWIESRGLRWDEDVRAIPQPTLDAIPKTPCPSRHHALHPLPLQHLPVARLQARVSHNDVHLG